MDKASRLHGTVLDCTCKCELRLGVEEMQDFQGALKDLSEEGYAKLKASMLRYGFSFPEFVWHAPDGWKTLDGHQRLRVLRQEGWSVKGGVPCVEIEATDEREAKEKLLLAVSAYGKVSAQGLYEFVSAADIDLAAFELPDLPGLDMDAFNAEVYEEPASPVGDTSAAGGKDWIDLVLRAPAEKVSAQLLDEIHKFAQQHDLSFITDDESRPDRRYWGDWKKGEIVKPE